MMKMLIVLSGPEIRTGSFYEKMDQRPISDDSAVRFDFIPNKSAAEDF